MEVPMGTTREAEAESPPLSLQDGWGDNPGSCHITARLTFQSLPATSARDAGLESWIFRCSINSSRKGIGGEKRED